VKSPIYGALAYLALEGETVETVTVARDDKPAGSVLDDWETLGCIQDAQVETIRKAGETVDCFDATEGVWIEDETENAKAQAHLQLNIQLASVTPFMLQMAMAAASVGASDGAYVPGSQPGGAYRGWLKVQQQNGTSVVNVLEMWVEATLAEPAVVARRQPGYKPRLILKQLKAADDAGVLGAGWS
jgi:hypothetical protein